MKTPYQEMREKSAHLIEKQRKAAEERAAKYKSELEAEQKTNQRKKNLEGIPSQAFSRANRRPASSSSASDILIHDVLSNYEDSNSSSSNDSYSSSSSSDSSSSSCSSDSSW